MKKTLIFLFLAVLFSSVGFAQFKGNTLTEEEYYAIKINDYPLLDIIRTRGAYSKLKSMFGNDLKFETIEEPYSGKEFSNSKILFRVEDDDNTLTFLELYYPSTITIKGKKVKIGDDIGLLGLVKVDTADGAYSVYFSDERTLSASLTIEANPKTKKITEIYYILF
jgi:hypothetical protein